MAGAACPYCDEHVEVEAPELGEEVRCPECEIRLKIVAIEPLELEEIGFDDDEDDEEDDDDFDDEEEDDEFDDDDDESDEDDEELTSWQRLSKN